MWVQWIKKVHLHLLLFLMLFTIPAFELNAGHHQIESPFIKPENGYATQRYYDSAISKCFAANMASHIRFDYMYSDFRAIKECIRGAKNFSKNYPVTCNPPHWGNIDGFAKRFGWDFCNPPDYLSNDTELRKVYNAALKRNCNIAKSSNKLDLDKLTNHIEKARAQSCRILSGEAEKERKAEAEKKKKEAALAAAKAKQEREEQINQQIAEGKAIDEAMCVEQRKVVVKAMSRWYQMSGVQFSEDELVNKDGSMIKDFIERFQLLQGENKTGYLTQGQIDKLLNETRFRKTYLDAATACESEKQKKIDDLFAEIEKDAAKECESKLASSKKKQIQIALTEEVGYSGPIDGNLDGSRAAIKAWQKKTNTDETGYVGCEQDKKLIFDNMEAIMAYADKQIEASKKAAEELEAARACEAELEESKKKQLQVALAPEGYDRATIDGELDGSREVIKAWQRSNGHDETGYLKCEHIKSVIAENIDKVMEYATGEIEVAQKNAQEEARKAEEEEANRIAEEKAFRCEVPGKYAEVQPYIEAEATGKTVYEFVETVRGYLDRRQLRKLQRTLKDHPRRSYYRSTIDGLWGKGTRNGVLDWIADENPMYQLDYVITKAEASCLIRDIAIAVEKSEQAQRAAEQAAAEAKKKKSTAQTQQKNTNTNTNSNNPANVLGNVNSVIGTIQQLQDIGGLLGGNGHEHDDHPEEDPNTALICDDDGVCRPQN